MLHGSCRLWLVALAISVIVWASATVAGADRSVVFATLVIGSQSAIRTRTTMTARTEAQWRTLWQQHTAGAKPLPPRPKIDFAHEMVLAAFAGPAPARTRIAIEAISAQRNQLTVVVRTTFDPSNREFNVLGGPDTPYHIVRTARSSLRIVYVMR